MIYILQAPNKECIHTAYIYTNLQFKVDTSIDISSGFVWLLRTNWSIMEKITLKYTDFERFLKKEMIQVYVTHWKTSLKQTCVNKRRSSKTEKYKRTNAYPINKITTQPHKEESNQIHTPIQFIDRFHVMPKHYSAQCNKTELKEHSSKLKTNHLNN